MVSLTRRQLLQGAAVGASVTSVSGCTGPKALGFGDDKTVPEPFTNDAYAASYVAGGRWSMEGHDGGRTGRVSTAVPRGNVGIAWLRRPGSEPNGTTTPIVGPNRVFIGYNEVPESTDQEEAYLAALDAVTGEQLLDVHVGTGLVSDIALADDTLLFVRRGLEYDQATLTALAPDDGSSRWSETVPSVTGPPAIKEGTSFLATRDDDNAVYAYALDGTQLWRTPLDGECYTATCVDNDGVYVGLTDGSVTALELSTGDRRWTEQVATSDECCPDIQGTPTVVDGRLYVPGISEELVAVDTTDGTVDWRTTLVEDDYGNAVPSPAVTAETAYVNTYHGGLVALSVADGSIRWRSSRDGSGRPIAVGDGGIVVPRHGSVVGYDGANNRAWSVDIKVPDATADAAYGMDTRVAVAHGLCYVGIDDGRIYAIGARG